MRTLFTVDAKKRYLALITFDGSVKSLQLMPNEQIPKQTRTRQNQNGASGQSAVAAPVVAPVAEARNECKVCFEREVDCVLISCGHQMICQKCAQYIVDNGDRQCPICRSRIERVQRVFT
ncbi:RNA-binding protein MEX3B [Halotydeus destructor]|nr:RNA-binding protein MEX3B [Halotydeus destructor]